MSIVLVLLIVAVAALLTLGAAFLASLLCGGLLMTTKRGRILVPIFFVIVPITLLGALTGGTAIGFFAIRANQNLAFLGPLSGLLLGGCAGFLIGLSGASIWWWRMALTKDVH